MSDPVFLPAVAESEFPEEGKVASQIGGWHVLVAQVDGMFHAYNDRCPHAAAMLSTGRLRRGAVMCPLHGARFDLTNGACVGGNYPPLRSFLCRVRDGWIEVAVPTTLPGMEDLPIITR